MRYAQIRSMDISNGEGVGISLFVQGCPFEPHCKNCFNSETWDFNGGKEWTLEVEKRFLELVNRAYVKRVSILGGEPLANENLDGVLKLVNKIRLSMQQKSIWLYTGYKFEELDVFNPIQKFLNGELDLKDCTDESYKNYTRQQIVFKCDVLIDGRYMDTERDITLQWRGSTNQRVIDIKQSLQEGEIVLWK